MTPEELHQQIVRNPDDDAPRLAYADAIEASDAARAEFIRLQVARSAAEQQSGARYGNPSRRERDLRAQHGAAWGHFIAPLARNHPGTGADHPFQGYDFERGFVALLRTEPDMAGEMGDFFLGSAPLQHLELTADGPFVAALTAPWLGRMRSLTFANIGLTDDDVIAFVERGHFERCEYLDLNDNPKITQRGLDALLASPAIRAMPVVTMHRCTVNPAVDVRFEEPELPQRGRAAEAKHGRIRWLHLDPQQLPDRFHARAASPEIDL